MGIIQKNSINSTIILSAGYGIGILSALFIYTLNSEVYGFATFLYNTSFFLFSFATLGIVPVVYKFFPRYVLTEKKPQKFFSFTHLIFLRNIAIFLLISYLLKEILIRGLSGINFNGELIRGNFNLIVILTIVLSYIFFFTAFLNGYKKIVLPLILTNLLYKFFLPGIVLFSIYYQITYLQIGWSIILFHFLVLCALGIHFYIINPKLFSFKRLRLSAVSLKEIRSYAGFSFLNKLAMTMAYRIDIIMIGLLLDTDLVGKYGILLVLSNVIDIPRRSIGQIAAPVISELVNNENWTEVKSIYKKASDNLLIIGLLIFGVIWVSMDNILALNESIAELSPYTKVFLCLAIAKIIDLVTSINSFILTYSKSYRVFLLFVIISGISNALVNYFFITAYGILGAAIATIASIFIFNAMKFIFIWVKFKMQVFSWTSLIAPSIFLGLIFLIKPLGLFSFEIINIGIKSFLFALAFMLPVYYLKLSPDINSFIRKTIRFK